MGEPKLECFDQDSGEAAKKINKGKTCLSAKMALTNNRNPLLKMTRQPEKYFSLV